MPSIYQVYQGVRNSYESIGIKLFSQIDTKYNKDFAISLDPIIAKYPIFKDIVQELYIFHYKNPKHNLLQFNHIENIDFLLSPYLCECMIELYLRGFESCSHISFDILYNTTTKESKFPISLHLNQNCNDLLNQIVKNNTNENSIICNTENINRYPQPTDKNGYKKIPFDLIIASSIQVNHDIHKLPINWEESNEWKNKNISNIQASVISNKLTRFVYTKLGNTLYDVINNNINKERGQFNKIYNIKAIPPEKINKDTIYQVAINQFNCHTLNQDQIESYLQVFQLEENKKHLNEYKTVIRVWIKNKENHSILNKYAISKKILKDFNKEQI